MGDLTEPRSDYVAYFKIFDHDPCDGSIDNSSPKNARVPYNTWPWGNSARKGLVKNFSRRVLEHLAGQGLEPCVANIYRAKERAKIDKSECMCFPWLVVEHKRTPSNRTEHCYSQAANGAHAVLTMHRILAKFVDKQLPDTKHIPPVTTITTIGSHVKVWVAYAIGEDNSCVRYYPLPNIRHYSFG